MEVRWSTEAADDLEKIINYIRQENPTAAQRVGKDIYEAAGSLARLPHRGRPGRVQSTRELVLPALPFILVYRVSGQAVEIVGVIHGAQRWPPDA